MKKKKPEIKPWKQTSNLTERSEDPLNMIIVKPGKKISLKILADQNEAVKMEYEHLINNYERLLHPISSKVIKDFKSTFKASDAEYYVGLCLQYMMIQID